MADRISIDQRYETPLQLVTNPRAEIRYLYAPSYDSRANDAEGQDYLVLRHSERTIAFAVCDGVGQSFCGQLAAQFLGNALVDWLIDFDAYADAADFATCATRFLSELIVTGQQRLAEYELPFGLPPLLRAALEQQRLYGSETMFACGKLQFPLQPTDPNDKGSVLLCWLGDTEIQLHDVSGSRMELDARWRTQERWSMSRGIRGADAVHAWTGDLSKISRIMAYSDGLGSIADRLRHFVDAPDELRLQMRRLYDSPTSDDISLVDLKLLALARPILATITGSWSDSACKLQWSPVQGAAGYLIDQAASPGFESSVSTVAEGNEACVSRHSGKWFYRVRAIYGGLHSQVSNVQAIRTLPGMHILRSALPTAVVLGLIMVLVWLLGTSSY